MNRLGRWLLVIGAVVACGHHALRAGNVRPSNETPHLPHRLADTGLYDASGAVAARNRPFSPQYPLWSDGAGKMRWVYLPDGAAIDARDPNAWDFPVDTRFWKEFTFAGRKVETRLLWKVAPDRWLAGSYVWSADGREATLAPPDGVSGAAELAPGKWHSVPSRPDCEACHGSGSMTPLGFTALQLSPDRDPGAVHAETPSADAVSLSALVGEGRLQGWPRGRPAPRIATSRPHTRAALGYLLTNCGSCHNGRGEISVLGPTLRQEDLLHDADAVARALVGQPTKWQVPGRPDGTSVLVDATAPASSALLVRMRSRSPSSQMPPLGTRLRDDRALETISRWIERELSSGDGRQ